MGYQEDRKRALMQMFAGIGGAVQDIPNAIQANRSTNLKNAIDQLQMALSMRQLKNQESNMAWERGQAEQTRADKLAADKKTATAKMLENMYRQYQDQQEMAFKNKELTTRENIANLPYQEFKKGTEKPATTGIDIKPYIPLLQKMMTTPRDIQIPNPDKTSENKFIWGQNFRPADSAVLDIKSLIESLGKIGTAMPDTANPGDYLTPEEEAELNYRMNLKRR